MGAFGHHALDLTGVTGDPGSVVHRLDPRTKLLGLFAVTVIAVSAPLAAWPVFAACAAILAAVAICARVALREGWRRGRAPLLLVIPVAAVVPFVRGGGSQWHVGPLAVHEAGLAILATVAIKATIGVAAAVLLAATTQFPDVVRGLQALRAPRLLVLVATLMYRYLFVVADEVQRMGVALSARSGRPRSVVRSGVLGRVVTALFLRSYARGERVHLAMLARGYDGTMPRAVPLTLHRADAVFVAAVASLLLPVRVLVGIG
ncbi:MAG: cobalt transporter, inner rane subunit CbiQ [Solirubrobacterales bacterium]|nr:cobalt transporter, inner rane subunit CbiQ [Solirubrobacterales bacterium]